jgi:predicted amidophosphoribosyltransferase
VTLRKLVRMKPTCVWCGNPLSKDGECNTCGNPQDDPNVSDHLPDERVSKTPSPRKQLTYALTKPRHVEGHVTLSQLAADAGMQAQLARLYVKRAKVEKPADGWRWKDGSRGLKKVRKILGLPV